MLAEYVSRKRNRVNASVGRSLLRPAIVLCLFGLLVAETVWASCTHWSLATDVLSFPNQKNPNPDSCGNPEVWYFMESLSLTRDSSTYSLLQNYTNVSGTMFNRPDLYNWGGSANHDSEPMPIVFKNNSATPIQYINDSYLVIQPNSIVVHPSYSGLVVVGWRSPSEGVISISGMVRKLHYGNTDWSIDKGGENLASGNFDNGTEQTLEINNVSVKKGDFVYFSVSPHGDFYADTTGLDIEIDMISSKKCDDSMATYSVANNQGKLTVPFVDVPLLDQVTHLPTGELAVFKAELKQLGGLDLDFGLVSSKLKLIFLTPAHDPCHAIYDETQKTLHLPFVDINSQVYDAVLQHLQTIPLDLGVFHLQHYQLVQ